MSKYFLFFILILLTINLSSCEDSSLSSESDSSSYVEFESAKLHSMNDTGEDCYYWFHGEKINLEETPGKKFLLFDTHSKDFINSATCKKIEGELQEISFPGMVYMNYDKQDKKRIKWLVADEQKLQEIQLDKYKGVVYASSFYRIPSEKSEIGVSHLFYVKLKNTSDISKLLELAEENKVNIIGNNKYLPRWYTVSCDKNSNGDALQMANLFYETGMFEASEPDLMGYSLNNSTNITSFNDTHYNSQWNLHGQYSINWESAYALSQGNNVSVAIVDTGIEQLHPDFNFGYGLLGFDTVNQDYDSGNIVYDSHGTACAGIIKATVGNGIGVAGIAPQATIYSICNPFNNSPNTSQQLSIGLIFASNYDVISCSWTGPSNTMIEDALDVYCFMWGRNGKGCVVVFSTGNNSMSTVSFPANCDDRILSVGASNSSGIRCSFSNYGSLLDVVAPGTEIPTTDLLGSYGYSANNYFLSFEGTSAACPHVAAIASLLLSVNPNLTRAEVNEIIQSTARKVGGYNYSNTLGKPDGTWNVEMGYGLVDAYAAVLEAIQSI